MKTAALVDGGFFIKRYRALYSDWRTSVSAQVAKDLYAVTLKNIRKVNQHREGGKYAGELYRIFFYDCPPLSKRLENPVSKRGFNFGDTTEARFRIQLHA